MSVDIYESGMYFGEYNENRVFHAEKSAIYKSLGDGISTVEFILLSNPGDILLIEAKSSSPKPGNHEKFDGFIWIELAVINNLQAKELGLLKQ